MAVTDQVKIKFSIIMSIFMVLIKIKHDVGIFNDIQHPVTLRFWTTGLITWKFTIYHIFIEVPFISCIELKLCK